MYFVFVGYPLGRPLKTNLVDNFVCSANKQFLEDANAKRKKMAEALSPSVAAEAQTVVIEEYLPYLFSMETALKLKKAEKKNSGYVWESSLSQSKKTFSNAQIEFELAMTLINYAFSLANFSSFTVRSFFKTLKSEGKTSETSSDLSKKCNHLYRRAAGALEYVKQNLIPVLSAGNALPLETDMRVIQALIDTMYAQAQILTIMIGIESKMNVVTLARVVMGVKGFLQKAFTSVKTFGSKGGLVIAQPFTYNLQLANTHYEAFAWYYVAESLYRKDLPDYAAAVAFYKQALDVNEQAKKFKVFVSSASDLETVAAFGGFVKTAYDAALHNCTRVFYKEPAVFSQVMDLIPMEANVTKAMDYTPPSILCSEIR